MDSGTRGQLEQAYDLIQQEDLNGAIRLLRPIVSRQPNNADAWWLLANAVSEPNDAYEALSNVIRLNPRHAEAQEQFENLLAMYPNLSSQAPTATFSSTQPMDSDAIDDLLGDVPVSVGSSSEPEDYASMFGKQEAEADNNALDLDDFFSSGSDSKATASTYDDGDDAALDAFFSGSSPAQSGAGGMAEDPFAGGEPAFMADAVPAEVKPDKKSRKSEPKQEAVSKPKLPKPQKIKEIVETPANDPFDLERRANRRPNRATVILLVVLLLIIVVGAGGYFLLPKLLTGPAPTAAPTLPGPVAGALAAAKDQLTSNKFSGANAVLAQSSLGDTFQAVICDKIGPELQDTVSRAMDLVASEAIKVKDTVKAAGLQVVRCDKADVTIYRAVAPIDAVVSYVSGGLTAKRDFRASWKKQ